MTMVMLRKMRMDTSGHDDDDDDDVDNDDGCHHMIKVLFFLFA